MKILLVSIVIVTVCFVVACPSQNNIAKQNSVKSQVVEPTPLKNQAAKQYSVKLSDVPEIFQQLKQRGSDGSFAVLMFSDHGKSGNENIINLQFSIENGKIGLDWILLAPVNLRDERRVFDFFTKRKAQPSRLTVNDVSYLRAESGDLVLICQDLMREMYGVKNEDGIEFLPEGFEWKPTVSEK